jgi:hypothetical protein
LPAPIRIADKDVLAFGSGRSTSTRLGLTADRRSRTIRRHLRGTTFDPGGRAPLTPMIAT